MYISEGEFNFEFQMDTYTDRSAMMSAVASVTYAAGRTNTAEALRVARETVLASGRGNRDGTQILTVTTLVRA